jgi:hypothetical protein
MKQENNFKAIKIYSVFIVFLLIMLPRLTSVQFGLLEDDAMLREVQSILSGDVSMGHQIHAVRFRPLYWGYFTLIYALAGSSAFWIFFGHTILLRIIVFKIWLFLIGLIPPGIQNFLLKESACKSFPITFMARLRGSYRMIKISSLFLLCPLLGEHGFCETPDPVIETREFRYGWEVNSIR